MMRDDFVIFGITEVGIDEIDRWAGSAIGGNCRFMICGAGQWLAHLLG